MKHYLLFVSHTYAYTILRPIQRAIRQRGDEAAWFIESTSPDLLQVDEKRLRTLREVKAFAPIAVIAPGNWVYPFFPGVKVEVFHGYPMRKRIEPIDDHFTLRGWWDIYCTQGPSSTPYFSELSLKNGYFKIYETGWSKVDDFFPLQPDPERARPCILYAPTFSKGISSAWMMAPVIAHLAETKNWDWIITFHPKLDEPALLQQYQQLAAAHPNVDFRRINEGIRTFRETDVLLCDSSSLIVEYLMTNKPAVTYRNTHPGPFLIDVQEAHEIGPAIEQALTHPDALMQAINDYTAFHEAHRDGHNSERVLDAIDDFIARYQGKLPRKPFYPIRQIKMLYYYLRTRILST